MQNNTPPLVVQLAAARRGRGELLHSARQAAKPDNPTKPNRAPAAWQPVIAALLDLGEAVGVAPRVFGALLWEHATGLAYLTAQSDLDLLWSISDERSAALLVEGLLRLDAAGPVRLEPGFSRRWLAFDERQQVGVDRLRLWWACFGELNSRAVPRGISMCHRGFRGAGERDAPCSSNLS
jgi:Phosphoribosyl-dephospho-CoA transferase MdcG